MKRCANGRHFNKYDKYEILAISRGGFSFDSCFFLISDYNENQVNTVFLGVFMKNIMSVLLLVAISGCSANAMDCYEKELECSRNFHLNGLQDFSLNPRFSRHVQKRMKERNISRQDILYIVGHEKPINFVADRTKLMFFSGQKNIGVVTNLNQNKIITAMQLTAEECIRKTQKTQQEKMMNNANFCGIEDLHFEDEVDSDDELSITDEELHIAIKDLIKYLKEPGRLLSNENQETASQSIDYEQQAPNSWEERYESE